MTDYIYDSITEVPDDVLKGNIRVFEGIVANINEHNADLVTIASFRSWLQHWKDELARRQPDSLYVTNPDGSVELVDDVGEVRKQ